MLDRDAFESAEAREGFGILDHYNPSLVRLLLSSSSIIFGKHTEYGFHQISFEKAT